MPAMKDHRHLDDCDETRRRRRRTWLLACWIGAGACTLPAAADTDEPAVVRVDFAAPAGTIRPLHGVNNGPLCRGETVDLSEYWKQIDVPLARLHDCDWPGGNVADMHAVFPDAGADPASPASYRFGRTDDYVAAIVRCGSGVVYRLGESIEHSRRKHHVHPPADPARWAQACVGIIRHYNQGWAEGSRHNIRYWEIWNEPENRPAMWTGNDEDYFRLYEHAAGAIAAAFPDVKVGGPSAGHIGEVAGDRLKATPMLEGLLERCKAKNVPLHFFSWHTYCDDPFLYARKARAVRRWLDERGFKATEIHLNEWNYLPSNDWGGMLAKDPSVRGRWHQELGAASAAAFAAAALCDLQDSPVDAANFYTGDHGSFGLFTREGEPRKTFYAFKAFRMLLDTPRRVKVERSGPTGGLAACAGLDADGKRATVLIANYRGRAGLEVSLDRLPWTLAGQWQLLALDDKHDLVAVRTGRSDGPSAQVRIDCPAPCVVVLRLTAGESAPSK